MNYHVDGRVVPAAEATVPVDDRGFRYGDRAVEPVRVHGGAPLAWDAHADRIATSCDRLSIPCPDDLRARVDDLVASGVGEALLSVSVTRGSGPGLTPADADPRVVIRTAGRERAGVAGSPPWDAAATLQTVKARRVPDRSVPANARTGARVDAVLARAELHDADEALILDDEGDVSGGADATLLFVDDEALHTPSLDGPVEPRVARSLTLALAESEGVPAVEGSYAPADVRDATEAVLATADGIRPVATVDGIDLPGGPVAPLLSALYDRHVEARCHGGETDPLADG